MTDLRAKSPAVPDNGQPASPGELLTSHLENTLHAAQHIQARVGRIPGLPDAFWTWVALAALLHDAGKLPYGFQRMIGNTPERPHVWGERHEVLSLGFIGHLLGGLPISERRWIATAVAGHHRAFTGTSDARRLPLFTQYGSDSPEEFATRFHPASPEHLHRLITWLHNTAQAHDLPVDTTIPAANLGELTKHAHQLFEELMDHWSHPLDFEETESTGLLAVLLLGAVTMADHLSSAHAPLHQQHPLTRNYHARLAQRLAAMGHALRPQQQAAGDTHGHMLLRSWTASGKTEASLLWARTQINDLAASTGGIPRVFYILPYLASINAMTDRLGSELQTPHGIGVAHSKAASYHLARSLDSCGQDRADAAGKAHSRAAATKNFLELLRVGTPYQLLRGALAGPAHSSILTDSANSVFILDELHAFDARRLGMILAMMRLWARMGGRVAILSATLPTALTELVSNALQQPVTLIEPPPAVAAPARHLIHTRTAHLTDEASLAEMRERLTEGRSVLVIANNVKDAILLYEALAPLCVELHGKDSAYLLHSRYRRMDRSATEAGILNRFEAGRPRLPGLLVGTQALEVSLNIDLDLCHTSAADLEALLQRFGRANRLGALPPVPVIVHQPAYTTRRAGGPALWADGVYEEDPTRLAWDILTQHNGETVDERITTTWLDEVYASAWGKQWHTTVQNHQRDFEEAFLSFETPFDDRSALAESFDAQFDGTEAILAHDLDDYAAALTEATDNPRNGRLLADEYLIPLPHWSGALTRYEQQLRVRVIDAEYDPVLGLLTVHGLPQQTYQPGEVL
ncbi:CRISPR-associated Cas3 family helicase [Streptomyces sp. CEV 2-1]|uniref:CRISPR-associated helicase Cas3' n=1 Tax=Streptomyces sp. CEV 2-1 TaxID=2485153 RepID=UPI000F4A206E|nr:CRISPR-associated helicase Cas3' [Streptomyces sp. CEV 2-1]ROQ65316.1 CRISPR-associated Cas3 family helicase [Streptomyces sp. CEV 2-1]